jgi:hypothetical protein
MILKGNNINYRFKRREKMTELEGRIGKTSKWNLKNRDNQCEKDQTRNKMLRK